MLIWSPCIAIVIVVFLLQNNIVDVDQEDSVTIHSNAEQNPIVDNPTTDSALNYGPNQIIIILVLHSPFGSKLT